MTKVSRLEWAILSVIMLLSAIWLGNHYTGFLPGFARGVLCVFGGWIMGNKVLAEIARDWRDQ